MKSSMTQEEALCVVKELVENRLAVMKQVEDAGYNRAKEAWEMVLQKAKKTVI